MRKMSVNDGVTKPKRVFQPIKNLYGIQNDPKLVPSVKNGVKENLLMRELVVSNVTLVWHEYLT